MSETIGIELEFEVQETGVGAFRLEADLCFIESVKGKEFVLAIHNS